MRRRPNPLRFAPEDVAVVLPIPNIVSMKGAKSLSKKAVQKLPQTVGSN